MKIIAPIRSFSIRRGGTNPPNASLRIVVKAYALSYASVYAKLRRRGTTRSRPSSSRPYHVCDRCCRHAEHEDVRNDVREANHESAKRRHDALNRGEKRSNNAYVVPGVFPNRIGHGLREVNDDGRESDLLGERPALAL